MSERQARVYTDEGVYIPIAFVCFLVSSLALFLACIQSLPLSFKIVPGVAVLSLLLLSP